MGLPLHETAALLHGFGVATAFPSPAPASSSTGGAGE